MSRSGTRKHLVLVGAFASNLKDVYRVFRAQNLSAALLLVALILLLSLLFTYLAFTPVLSPFIYPLF